VLIVTLKPEAVWLKGCGALARGSRPGFPLVLVSWNLRRPVGVRA